MNNVQVEEVRFLSHKIDEAMLRLVTVGRKILIEEGYENFNIRKLVNICGISIGTFYNNFSSKQELTIEILNTDWREILDTIDIISPSELSFKEKLQDIYLLVHDFFHNYKSVFIEMMIEDNIEKNKNMEIKKSFCDRMRALLQAEIDKGTIKIDIDAVKMAYIILQNFIYMSKEDYLSFDEFYQCIFSNREV
jgi:AcrR family transcriptional regulator